MWGFAGGLSCRKKIVHRADVTDWWTIMQNAFLLKGLILGSESKATAYCYFYGINKKPVFLNQLYL